MKKKLILLLAACFATIGFAKAKDLNIQGTWKLLAASGRNVPAHYLQIKLITPTHAMWMLADNQGNVVDGSGATYTMEGGKYTGSIDMVLPAMKKYCNYHPVFEMSVNGNMLTQKGYMRDVAVTEVWEKTDPATKGTSKGKNPGIRGVWKLLERNGEELPAPYSQIMLITPSRFMWMKADNQGNIVNGAAGTYTIENGTLTETIDMVMPGMKRYYNYKPAFELSVEGNRMTKKGNMRETEITEVWDRIE